MHMFKNKLKAIKCYNFDCFFFSYVAGLMYPLGKSWSDLLGWRYFHLFHLFSQFSVVVHHFEQRLIRHRRFLDDFVTDYSLERVLFELDKHLLVVVVHEVRWHHVDDAIEVLLDWVVLLVQLFLELHLLLLQGSLCFF